MFSDRGVPGPVFRANNSDAVGSAFCHKVYKVVCHIGLVLQFLALLFGAPDEPFELVPKLFSRGVVHGLLEG